MSDHIKIGVIVGIIGAITGIALLAVFMGLPLGNLIIALPLGVTTGLLVGRAYYRRQKVSTAPLRESAISALIAGALTTISAIIPVVVLVIFRPPPGSAYLSTQFCPACHSGLKYLNLKPPSPTLDDIRIAIPFWSTALATLQVGIGIGLSVLSTWLYYRVKQQETGQQQD